LSELTPSKYYSDAIDLKDMEALEARLRTLLQQKVTSVADLEEWLVEERKLRDEIGETRAGHGIDFYRDTGVEFDFSEQTVEETAKFVESMIAKLQ